jgi:hypothetical protein
MGRGLPPPGLPRLVTVDLAEPAEGGDKMCGGVMEVFVECIAPAGEHTSQSVPP